MPRFTFSRFAYRARAKSRSKTKSLGWIPATTLFASVLAFYCVLFPDNAGQWGRNISDLLGKFVGLGRFILPVIIGYASLRVLFAKEKGINALKTLIATGLFISVMVFLTLLGQTVWSENLGGIVGYLGEMLFVRLFGTVGAWIVTFGAMGSLSILLAGIHPGELFHKIVDMISHDWQEWKKAKADVKAKPARVKEPRTAVVPPVAALSAPPKAAPKISGLNGENGKENGNGKEKAKEAAAASMPAPASASPSASRKDPEIVKRVEKTPKTDEKAAPPPKSTVPYTSPSLDIFETAANVSPVAKEELTSKARLLEQTLANFNIAATVVEIHPGPVITRYDLEPAPGVKVSSISSRADDLALALRSTGIRVIAPIPGKGAVGIEIPNSKPEMVVLRDLLARPEFFNHPSPLAFVLGKTVSGEPAIVDLAAMPHMLIAGATGAGKSVAVHSMIASILYRMPPDLVKFVMIDPKRLELPSYSSIPHLYDPRVGPLSAEVITNSKQAAKALVRLVKVMEYRYDRFAKANVRNIDSFNRKQKEQGLPPEYYLVVIIDELADLMLTAPKDVEDSVQRLAQMARAVGIHLVLATQRPSVDVITGVIKANLPSRIALRVASAIDSRVIIDSVGAESLLGKGDMLYLPPASPDAVRVQGAYVSEKDVEHLVTHVKQFGLPHYEDLFGMGSALEFAVEDKKEMRDLVDALKLILERHRVSQDLLKAHFGSSARATNILSLLEVKEFINKPEGTNKWEINFDLIETFLGKVTNMPDEEPGE